MKFAAITLLLATLTLATPNAAPATPQTNAELEAALSPREADSSVPEIDARAAGIQLSARDPKKGKPKTGGGNDNSTDSAAGMMSPSLALELGALGLGIMEVVRLWG
ncbi:uncharacterized protein BDR25DRAFT_299946 [Lindgomyces ingoldianus]|uniref:Uncharacterized protein n=1 Tax=Lindgomyces ingoldianus TaxID=673940 RepID=A0ACB6RGE9_9PLEO|nr:uncharacterized protein BDR25DRAFT_299946 [Lindgomyces ingoldianus]KAF2478334.1 hypothetical protein BDR25DRAFT_299946 [Lindgomyces ingoldianus]